MEIDEYRHHRDGDKRNDAARKSQFSHFFAADERRQKQNRQLHGLHEGIQEQILPSMTSSSTQTGEVPSSTFICSPYKNLEAM